jgi:uncharacterized membrane protein YgcG
MLWTAVSSDYVLEAERFALVNNEKFLNLDEDNETVVMDDNDERTRWLYETIEADDEDEDAEDVDTLTYALPPDTYYTEVMEMVAQALEAADTEDADEQQAIQFTMTDDQGKAITIVLFQLSTSEETVSTTSFTGTLVLTSTPSAIDTLENTPHPTATPNGAGQSNGLTGVSPTAVPTAPVEEPIGGNTSTGGSTGNSSSNTDANTGTTGGDTNSGGDTSSGGGTNSGDDTERPSSDS